MHNSLASTYTSAAAIQLGWNKKFKSLASAIQQIWYRQFSSLASTIHHFSTFQHIQQLLSQL